VEFAGGRIILGLSYGTKSFRTHAGDTSGLQAVVPASAAEPKAKQQLCLSLLMQLTALIFQVENLVKTKN